MSHEWEFKEKERRNSLSGKDRHDPFFILRLTLFSHLKHCNVLRDEEKDKVMEQEEASPWPDNSRQVCVYSPYKLKNISCSSIMRDHDRLLLLIILVMMSLTMMMKGMKAMNSLLSFDSLFICETCVEDKVCVRQQSWCYKSSYHKESYYKSSCHKECRDQEGWDIRHKSFMTRGITSIKVCLFLVSLQSTAFQSMMHMPWEAISRIIFGQRKSNKAKIYTLYHFASFKATDCVISHMEWYTHWM